MGIEGTFTGFLHSLGEVGVDKFEIAFTKDIVTMRVVRDGKQAQVMLQRVLIAQAKADIASVELGDILNAVL